MSGIPRCKCLDLGLRRSGNDLQVETDSSGADRLTLRDWYAPLPNRSFVNLQVVKDFAFDCDGDTLLIQVEQTGAACHEGYKSCFFRSVEGGQWKTTEAQLETPEQIYGKT